MKKVLKQTLTHLIGLAMVIFTTLFFIACPNPNPDDGSKDQDEIGSFRLFLSRDAAGTCYDLVYVNPASGARAASPEGPSYRLVVTERGQKPTAIEGSVSRSGNTLTLRTPGGRNLTADLDGSGELTNIGGDLAGEGLTKPSGLLTPYYLYLAGYIGNNSNPSYPYFNTACYWNGKDQIELPVPSGKKSWAGAITVKNGNVYVAGCYENTTNGYGAAGCYWKDGVRYDLEDCPTDPSNVHRMSIAVTNSGDIYVVPQSPAYNYGTYWKNGQKIDMGNDESVNAVTTYGNDVYLAGGFSTELSDMPCYWKNGVRIDLTGSAAKGNSGQAISVSGGDVYVLGMNYICYWKNGVEQQVNLTDCGYPAFHSLFVDGNDVYISGYASGDNGYWKNNEFFRGFNVTIPYIPAVVAAFGENVYLAVADGHPSPTPGYWINGERVDVYTPLTNGFHGHIMGIWIEG